MTRRRRTPLSSRSVGVVTGGEGGRVPPAIAVRARTRRGRGERGDGHEGQHAAARRVLVVCCSWSPTACLGSGKKNEALLARIRAVGIKLEWALRTNNTTMRPSKLSKSVLSCASFIHTAPAAPLVLVFVDCDPSSIAHKRQWSLPSLRHSPAVRESGRQATLSSPRPVSPAAASIWLFPATALHAIGQRVWSDTRSSVTLGHSTKR